MKFVLSVLLLAVAMLFNACSACSEAVPAGHIGRTWEPGGFSEGLLGPGYHSCTGRCQMYLMEVTDKDFEVPMKVLCSDSLNFSFSVNVLVAVDTANTKVVEEAFANLKPDEGTTRFTVEQLFNTYVRPVVDQESRKVVSKYKTTEIVNKRSQVIEEVLAAVKEATKGSILTVKRVTVGNLDFPKVVTDAQEQKAKRQVEIETAKAQARIDEAKASAKLKLAEIQYKQELVEAAMVADANKVIAGSITPQYLAYKQLEVIQGAAQGPNNWGFVPYTDMVNKPVDTSHWLSPQGIVDAELLKRIQEAKDSAKEADEALDNLKLKAESPKPQ